jgi:hypothetical protein
MSINKATNFKPHTTWGLACSLILKHTSFVKFSFSVAEICHLLLTARFSKSNSGDCLWRFSTQ